MAKEEIGSKQNPYLLNVSFDIEITHEDIDDIMCTALEGGICYWCSQAEVVGEYLGEYGHEQISRGGILRIHDIESREIYDLDKEKFMKGLKLFLEQEVNLLRAVIISERL